MKPNQYEAMFVFDPTVGSSFEKCEAEVRRLMERAEAELVFCKKWDERRLAYPMSGRKRAVYVLTYFKAMPEKISPLERDAKLSENVLRVLVLRADEVTPERMERWITERKEERDDRGGRDRDDRGGRGRDDRGGRGRDDRGRGRRWEPREGSDRSGEKKPATETTPAPGPTPTPAPAATPAPDTATATPPAAEATPTDAPPAADAGD